MKAQNLKRNCLYLALATSGSLLAMNAAFGSSGGIVFYPEGFNNFNFELAQGVPSEPGPLGWDYWSPDLALPCWRLLANEQPYWKFVSQNQWHSDVPDFVLFGPNTSEVVSGNYSAGLKAGFDTLGNAYSVSLAAIGDISANAQSLQIKIANGSSTFRIFLGGSEIPMMPTFANSGYTLFTGDVSQFAGLKTELRITVEGGESRIILDDVLFSSEVVPEPNCAAILLAGLWFCRKTKSLKLHSFSKL